MVLQIGQHRIRIVDVLESDNCKNADYPLRLIFKIPEETVVIERCELTYVLEKFRAYTKSDLRSDYEFNYGTNTSSITLNSPWITGATNTFIELIAQHTSSSVEDIIFIVSFNTTEHYTKVFRIGTNTGYANTIHVLLNIPYAAKDETITIETYDTSDNPVNMNYISAMAWAVAYRNFHDIYELDYYNPSISIKIDGVDRTSELGGPFTAEGKVLNITDYITEPGLHIVELIPNQLVRLTGHIYARCIIGFAGEVAKIAGRYNYSFYNYTVYG